MRQNSIIHNRFSRYLLYAIGEIILVVIGILIALQVNNWNQERTEIKETRDLLSNLQLDVKEDIINLKNQQQILSKRKKWADLILQSIDDQKTNDSTQFITAMTRVGWILNYSQTFPTYTEIVSSGKLSYIKSENLKKALADYQSQVEENQQIISSYNSGLKETERLGIGYLNGMPEASNSMQSASSYPGVSFDLKLIALDRDFYKSVKQISYQTAVTIDYIGNLLITKAEGLNVLIADEIKNY